MQVASKALSYGRMLTIWYETGVNRVEGYHAPETIVSPFRVGIGYAVPRGPVSASGMFRMVGDPETGVIRYARAVLLPISQVSCIPRNAWKLWAFPTMLPAESIRSMDNTPLPSTWSRMLVLAAYHV